MGWGPIGNGGEEWFQVNLTTVHRAAPAPGELGEITSSKSTTPTIWTPPAPCYVRGMVVHDDQGDPISAVDMSVTHTADLANDTFVEFTQGYDRGLGWGVRGPQDNSTDKGTQEAGVLLYPAGSVPGRPADARELVALATAGGGPIVGTLHWHFEYMLLQGGFA